jgi:hypothetical protein
MNISKLRDLILDINEINETRNPWAIARKMVDAIKTNEIDSREFELLTGTLYQTCGREKIHIPNQVCQLLEFYIKP